MTFQQRLLALAPPAFRARGRDAYRSLRLAMLPRRRVALDRLLLGDEGGIPADRYARLTDDPLRPSTVIERWPHVRLLEQFDEIGEAVLAPERFFATDYARNALQCLEITGNYFQARKPGEIVAVARAFLDFHRGASPSGGVASRRGRDGHSDRRAPIIVRPILHSDCYQVVDGHHRAAIAWVGKRKSVAVAVRRPAALTPLQSLLLDVAWANGARELYQPVAARELQRGWALVRRCDDRLEKMTALLREMGLPPESGASYLDVACNCGWFVGRMQALGYDAWGVERNPAACRLAALVNGVEPRRIARADVVSFLAGARRKFDVVACLSLLHHFVLGRGAVDAPAFARLLDSVTGRVLFLDTGQNHEKWFRDLLPEWDVAHIERWLLKHTTFKRVVGLGADADGVPPYAGNYGRMLFACLR